MSVLYVQMILQMITKPLQVYAHGFDSRPNMQICNGIMYVFPTQENVNLPQILTSQINNLHTNRGQTLFELANITMFVILIEVLNSFVMCKSNLYIVLKFFFLVL
jgi:hypothetical protein